MVIDKHEITRYIPQRAPFVMIDELVSAEEKGFTSTFLIHSDNLFIENGILSESALVENIAQTCAAGFGYLNSLKGKEEGQLGFIGAVSKLSLNELPNIGDKLSTNIEIINTFDTIHLIQGNIFSNGKKLIECQMKIVLA